MIDTILNFGSTILDKIFPDKTQTEVAKAKLNELAKSGELEQIAGHYKLGIAEAKSEDKWTSRGRPSVIYATLLFIVFAIPFGIFYAIYPSIGIEITKGMDLWFKAIPSILYECLSGIIGLYSVCRTQEKIKGIKK